jgi:hypothetical protein
MQRGNSRLDKYGKVFAPTTVTKSNLDLPILSCVKDWAHLWHIYNHADFASLANTHTNDTGSPVIDSSSAALITPDLVQHYAYRN